MADSNSSGGPGILGIAAGIGTGALAAAKLGGFAQISWLVVFTPFLAWLALIFILLTLVMIGAVIAVAVAKD